MNFTHCVGVSQLEVYQFAMFVAAAFLIIFGGAIVSLYIQHAWIEARQWWKRRKGNEP